MNESPSQAPEERTSSHEKRAIRRFALTAAILGCATMLSSFFAPINASGLLFFVSLAILVAAAAAGILLFWITESEKGQASLWKQKVAAFVLMVTLLPSLLTIIGSLYPGFISDVFFAVLLLSLMGSPLLLIVGIWLAYYLFVVIDAAIKGVEQGKRAFLRLALAFLIFAISSAVAVSEIPMNMAFAAARPSFEALVPEAPRDDEYYENLKGRWVGIWYVDEYWTDSRGGVYFRVGSSWDVAPDRTSHGFAYKLNPEGTPFGNAVYHHERIVEDWHYFSASDDW